MAQSKKKRIKVYATNTLGVLCLLLALLGFLVPVLSGTLLLLAGLSLLSINNVWAKRLKEFAEKNTSNLMDLIFLENKKCQWAWDIFVYLSLAGGAYLFIKFDFNFIVRIILTTILGFIVVVWFRNYHRWQRLLKYLKLIPAENKVKRQPSTLKAITLHQPWASLIAIGAKTVETRSWRPPEELLGQRIAIHASKQKIALKAGALSQEVDSKLGKDWRSKGIFGAVVATAKLQRVKKINNKKDIPSKKKALFGDYALGRWMWELTDIEKVEPPVPARGQRGFWNLKEKI